MRRIKLFLKKLWNRFKDSQFVAHVSFLWHWKNFFLLMKYPFYRVYNRWEGYFCGYAFTELDYLPVGWRKAFGKQMSEDIKKAGKESRKRLGHKSWKEMLVWEQIKEKYGSLRLYASATEEIQKVLDKYEYMSYGYCICCGKPVRYKTRGWITFVCEDCFMVDLSRHVDENEKQRILKECRLTSKDLPSGTRYTTNKKGKVIGHKINYKRIYGIDLKKLWDVK